MATQRATDTNVQRLPREKASAAAVVLGAAAVLVLGVVYALYQALSIYTRTTDGLSRTAELLAHEVAGAIVERDVGSADRALRLIAERNEFSTIAIYTADGSIFSHYSLNETEPARSEALRTGTYVDGGKVVHNKPVVVDNNTIGAISMSASLQVYYRRLFEHLLIVLIAIVVSLSMAFVSWRLQRRFAQRELALRRAKESAERANRMKSRFLANMTHEIRTPMNSVIGMTDLLANTQLTGKQHDYVHTIRNSGELLLSVVADNLDLFKLEADTVLLERGEFSVEDVVESTIEMLGYNAYSKNVELACRYARTTGLRLLGDPDRLRQIIVNLLTNAIKFTQEGQITVECSLMSQKDGEARLSFAVKDTGIGIEPDFLEHVFDMLSQSSAAVPRHEGVGLGLSICKQLVEMMGGEIHAQSERGVGSNFWFEVPFDEAPIPDSEERRPPSAEGRRVLVVDDNETIGRLVCEYTSGWGMRPDYEAHANAALHRLNAEAACERYQLAIIDVDMPTVDGVTLATRIQEVPAIASTPVVLMASVAQPLPPGIVSSLPRTRCINKPILPRALRDTVLELLGDGGRSGLFLPSIAPAGPAGIDTGARVLVAEDNPASQLMLLDMLTTLGVRADGVADGRSVIDAMQSHPYDLILLDCQMPGMDGYEVTVQLRQRQSDPLRPVIVAVSAFASAEHTRRCLKLGMNDYIPKPVRLESLRQMLTKWIPRTNAPPAADAPALDGETWNDWRQYKSKNPALFVKLSETFVNDADQRLAEISETWQSGATTDLAKQLHGLRAGCLQLGAKRMAASCLEIEHAAERGSAEVLPSMLQRLREEYRLVRRELENAAGSSLGRPPEPASRGG